MGGGTLSPLEMTCIITWTSCDKECQEIDAFYFYACGFSLLEFANRGRMTMINNYNGSRIHLKNNYQLRYEIVQALHRKERFLCMEWKATSMEDKVKVVIEESRHVKQQNDKVQGRITSKPPTGRNGDGLKKAVKLGPMGRKRKQRVKTPAACVETSEKEQSWLGKLMMSMSGTWGIPEQQMSAEVVVPDQLVPNQLVVPDQVVTMPEVVVSDHEVVTTPEAVHSPASSKPFVVLNEGVKQETNTPPSFFISRSWHLHADQMSSSMQSSSIMSQSRSYQSEKEENIMIPERLYSYIGKNSLNETNRDEKEISSEFENENNSDFIMVNPE